MEGKNSRKECRIGPQDERNNCTVANGRPGLGIHPPCWWSKESAMKKRKMVSEEIHNFEEVRRIVTVVGQRKQDALPRWDSAKDRAVTWSDLKPMEPKKLSFLIKAVYDVLLTQVNLHTWGLTTSDRYKACGENSQP